MQDYIDLPHKPRYPFGFGLSYTRFEYGDLVIDGPEVGSADIVRISLTVKNMGEFAGDEIVQLYISDRYASMTRPNMELAGFKRISLLPGEQKTVKFTLQPSQLAFVDRAGQWKIEAGDNDVMVGASSADIRLMGSFRISSDQTIDPQQRGFYAAAGLE